MPSVRIRIVSLVPSVTETLRAWNRDPIACTRFCEQPDLLHVGGTKDPDVAKIIELRPDLVVVDAEENRREDHDAMVGSGLEVLALHVRSVDDVRPALATMAARLEVDWLAPELGDPSAQRLRAFVPIWRRPWMALGIPTYGASLLARHGVGNIFDDRGAYPTVSLAEAAQREPDVVLAPSEPYPFTERQLPELAGVAPTVFVDGKDLFWWGVRTPGALARLGEVLAEL